MQGGSNADLLREIRALMRQLPEMTVKLVKVKVHRKREAETYHEVIHDEMDTLSNILQTAHRRNSHQPGANYKEFWDGWRLLKSYLGDRQQKPLRQDVIATHH